MCECSAFDAVEGPPFLFVFLLMFTANVKRVGQPMLDLALLTRIAQHAKDCKNARGFCKHDNGIPNSGTRKPEAVLSLNTKIPNHATPKPIVHAIALRFIFNP